MNDTVMCRCGKNPAIINSNGDAELCITCRRTQFSDEYARKCREVGFGNRYVNASFNYYKEDFIADIKRVTGDFVNSSLLLSGASSTGKTFLMAAICNDFLIRQGVPANEMYYINVIELFAEIGADITQFESIVSHCAEVRYLFLDEVIPAKTEWEHRALYLILERRRNNSLVTISTTNYDTQKLDGQIVSRLLDLNGIHYSMTRKCWS